MKKDLGKRLEHFWHKILPLYFHKQVKILALVGLISGMVFPLGLQTLNMWISQQGLAPQAIGFSALLHLPYCLKFFFEPIISVYRIPFLWQRLGMNRSWLLVCGLLVSLGIWQIGSVGQIQKEGFFWLSFWVFWHALFSGMQDLVLYGYLQQLNKKLYAPGASISIAGYRIGNFIGGFGVIKLSLIYGWQKSYCLASLLNLVLVIFLVIKSKKENFLEPFSLETMKNSFFAWIKTIKNPLLLVIFIFFFKSGDGFVHQMLTVNLLNAGYTPVEITTVVKFFGLGTIISGTLVSGFVIKNYGLNRSIFVLGFLHAFSMTLLGLTNYIGNKLGLFYFLVGLENFSSGLLTSAFAAYLFKVSKSGHQRVLYSIFWAISSLGRGIFASFSGVIYQTVPFYLFCILGSSCLFLSLFIFFLQEKRLA